MARVKKVKNPQKGKRLLCSMCVVTLVVLVGSFAYAPAVSALPVPKPVSGEGTIPSAVSGPTEKVMGLIDGNGAAPDAAGGSTENLAPRLIERGPNFERWDLGGRFAWNSAPQWVWDGSEWVPYIYENRYEEEGYYQVQSGLIGVRIYDYYAEFYTPDLSEIRVHDERWEVQRWVTRGRGGWDDVGAQSGTPVFSVVENGNDITVKKTFSSWAGELEISYIFREGLPMKREVVWTSAIGENTTFRVLQRWAGIAGSRVRHGGGMNRVASALVIDSPFFEFQDDNGRMTVLESQHPMYYDENGERLTEHRLKPVKVEAGARGMKADFVFENWTLAAGESLRIDPYTSTLSNPTEDGHIVRYGAVDRSGYARDSTGDVIRMYWSSGYQTYAGYRGYVEWDISSIPDGASITKVVLKYHGKATGSGAHIHEMVGTRPSKSSDSAVYNEAGNGTVYADPSGFPAVGTNKQVDLGASAASDLQNQLSSDWFAIGLDFEGTSAAEIYAEEYSSASPRPTLYVEYTVRATCLYNPTDALSGDFQYVASDARDRLDSMGHLATLESTTTESEFIAALETSDVLHFCDHGRFKDSNRDGYPDPDGWISVVLDTQANVELTPQEILNANPDIVCRLIIFEACGSGASIDGSNNDFAEIFDDEQFGPNVFVGFRGVINTNIALTFEQVLYNELGASNSFREALDAATNAISTQYGYPPQDVVVRWNRLTDIDGDGDVLDDFYLIPS